MIDSDVYEKAAFVCEKRQMYGCTAIYRVTGGDRYYRTHAHLFSDYFKPRKLPEYGGWFGLYEIKENQDHRILALLLMAEIAEDLK